MTQALTMQTVDYRAIAPENIMCAEPFVHVWCASLERTPNHLQSLWALLSPDERRRAESFYFRKDRDRFVLARALLRIVLGRYLKLNAAEVRFSYSAYGKPALAQGCGTGEIRFNLSHSNALALYAVTRGREIGVDIEYIRPELAGEEIAERFFSAAEAEALRRLPAHQRTEAFFNCWTRKEAYIKAIGEGLSVPLNEFDVTLVPGEAARLLKTSGNLQEASRWSLLELAPAPGYVAALALEGELNGVSCWQLTTAPFAESFN